MTHLALASAALVSASHQSGQKNDNKTEYSDNGGKLWIR